MNKTLLLSALFGMAVLGAKAQVGVSSVYPAPSATEAYSYNLYYDITVSASEGITSFGTATFSYNDESVTLEKGDYAGLNGAPDNYFLQLKISTPGLTNYAQMAMEAGAENFKITITDVMCGDTPVTENLTGNDNITVDNGTITLTYKVEAVPVYLPEESYWPLNFYSYWAPGDPNGIAKLVFSKDVVSVYEVDVVMAEVAEGSEGVDDSVDSYNLLDKVSFSGNVMSIDFTGTQYDSFKSKCTVIIKSVYGADGQPAILNGNSVTLYQVLNYLDETAGITSLEAVKEGNNEIYNLKGVKVSSNDLTPGLYIINGKKVLVK